jgi:hypothetical protein
LAHVRQGKDASGNLIGDELAVIIGSRLSRKGGSSRVHLISLEGRYANGAFDFQQAEGDDLIRLLSLANWSFACVDEKQSFKGLLKHLNHEPGTLQLPHTASAEAQTYLSAGCVLVPHSLRQGYKTVSWYHGPLVPGENTSVLTLPVRAADEVVRYDPSQGVFDVSYAAAWELGRLLALQSKQLSINLYNWKRANAQQLKQAEQRLFHTHLPVQGQTIEDVDIPPEITSWFNDLSLLQGVPFNYLVPDERMLPKESICFVWLDHIWIDCLLDGAFSIGRVTTSDHQQDQSFEESPATNPYEKVTGILLRSDVVAGWPGLLVDAYDEVDPEKGGNQLGLLRTERLSESLLLCLFEGALKRVEVHQKPETLHFGLDSPDETHTDFYKTLRGAQGQVISAEVDSIPWRQAAQRVLDIQHLAHSIQEQLAGAGSSPDSFTSAQFALQMIEGVEKVIFQIHQTT